MKVSEKWLRDFVDIPVDVDEFAETLSLSGLEVSSVSPAVPDLPGVFVARVLEVNRHPDANSLTVCKVDAGDGDSRQIVCGASNVYPGMKAPVILPGNRLPGGDKIRKSKLRGIESQGMLCSARELELGDEHEGIYELPGDAKVGQSLAEFLGEDDSIVEIEITPNRGDCLSMLGVARDTAAIFDVPLRQPRIEVIQAEIMDVFPVTVEEEEACPVFGGRVIRGVDASAKTPLWMQERLRRAGIRPLSPVVDITQYVMVELGQPMHAYDLDKLNGGIVVRWAKPGEALTLLDGGKPELAADMLVIADHERALGLGGIMGGQESAVSATTENLYLESAFFAPAAIAGRSRKLDLHTDAAYRFERGVDPDNQARAIERATQLILEICGGVPGPVDLTRTPTHDTRRREIVLRRERLARVLGIEVPDDSVTAILDRLAMQPKPTAEGWRVKAPSHRFDIEIEEDLVEEVGRLHGYDKIPAAHYPTRHPMERLPEGLRDINQVRQQLVARGYQEVITYSFVASEMNRALSGEPGLRLSNPISSDMVEMRRNLWPGLLETLRYNRNRQQSRVRIFETGLRFNGQGVDIEQENVLAGLISGTRFPTQWGVTDEPVDFADLKGDVEGILPANATREFEFKVEAHPALHPGQSARITRNGENVGWLGALHPGLAKSLELDSAVFVFEIGLQAVLETAVPSLQPVPKYPAIQRDLAVVVDESVAAQALLSLIWTCEPERLRDLRIFDIYRGKGIDSGRKSIALSLILQESSRTLNEEAVDKIMANIASRLAADLGAQIRE